ncbi:MULTISPECIES: hypothetical protein [Streptomycetaceae]|uniref:Uncharacterized protein n=1 Tax=Streptantibioticus cattleyicolor (strain ATCC 35852 / DSM 46488 / JCM 4925 / NBRC 14057 / NRRL 8057) TaxID=1003195 RepID=F8JT40_STREN|nr:MULTISPECIES: hypothetical protein [Streptomycetaceae]AEW92975.1 hypothetical protein SCATT_06040 [Streptantibioticus cattleyicolor NRRL 8057 = DSM 46488]MYS57718.1 hypothetical protein [Streptomyces sp. SID5468]CCB73336.1 protein of unknown function [Streptantibioticus cattleyicolor NRRL 8057 = DSM 46488]
MNNDQQHSAPEPQAAPEWRTFRGVTTPCWIWCGTTGDGRLYAAGDRNRADGEPLRMVRTWVERYTRIIELADGRIVIVGGPSTKAWIAAS